ncbi:hypothetical protein AURDEDRAFT_168833 [Auricularia subglabra TFB-10046 SS5]|nr:hypothetical protein AURDEDRAFT_168833 [Auricularia subglabra TFB-10046 SS5]
MSCSLKRNTDTQSLFNFSLNEYETLTAAYVLSLRVIGIGGARTSARSEARGAARHAKNDVGSGSDEGSDCDRLNPIAGQAHVQL